MTRNQALNQWGRCSSVEAFAARGLIGRVCQDVALGEDQSQTFMVNEVSAVAVTVSGVSQAEGKDKAPAALAEERKMFSCIAKINKLVNKQLVFKTLSIRMFDL